jgi:hypothetical protein
VDISAIIYQCIETSTRHSSSPNWCLTRILDTLGTDGASEAEEEKTEEEEEEPDVPGMEGGEEFEGPKVLWVVTKGCFNKHGVAIGQASLYAAARNLEVEVDDMAVRIADLAGG